MYKDFKNDTAFHEVLKQACLYVYGNAEIPTNYFFKDIKNNSTNTGFYAKVLQNRNNIIIA